MPKKHRYISGLDGLRAIAVIGVILYHFFPNIFIGGYLGVPLFFVISGYLITGLLLFEFSSSRKIDIWGFYIRRFKRLYPALLAVLGLSITYIALFNPDLLPGLRGIFWTNVFYVYNWWEIGHGQSYFDRFNRQSPFTHLWSLSVEGQFYFLWPAIVLLLLEIAKKRDRYIFIFGGILIASFFSFILCAWLFRPADISRVYYGSDTRMFSILLGAALAFIWPSDGEKIKFSMRSLSLLRMVGWMSLSGVICGFFLLNGQSPITYQVGMYLFSIVATILIAAVVHPCEIFGKLLNNPVMNWIGARSYGIYVYQFPIIIFYEQAVPDFAENPLVHGAVRLIMIAAISELSYRYLETPLRQYHYLCFKQPIPEIVRWIKGPFRCKLRFAVVTAVLILFSGMTVAALTDARASNNTRISAFQKEIEQNQKEVEERNLSLDHEKNFERIVKVKEADNENDAEKKLTPHQKELIQKYNITASTYLAVKDAPLTVIGDSLALRVAPLISSMMPYSYINGKVSRQVYQSPPIITTLQKQGRLANNVLIILGTNGDIPQNILSKIVSIIGEKRHIYWVNINVARPWEKKNNLTLQNYARDHKNFTVVDWKTASNGKPDYFIKDRVHTSTKGGRIYVKLIFEAIAKQIMSENTSQNEPQNKSAARTQVQAKTG